MRVLLTDASRDGAADAVAERIAERLRGRGLTVHLTPIEQAGDVEAHDAVVVGGDASSSHWLRPARRFVEQHEEELARRPVWLYSSAAVRAAEGADTPEPAPRPQEFDTFHGLVEPEDEAVFVARVADPRRSTTWFDHVRRLLGRRMPPRCGPVRPGRTGTDRRGQEALTRFPLGPWCRVGARHDAGGHSTPHPSPDPAGPCMTATWRDLLADRTHPDWTEEIDEFEPPRLRTAG